LKTLPKNRKDKLMTIKQISTSLLLVTLFLQAGCKKDDNPVNQGGTNPTVLMPLKIGNQWIYRAVSLDSLGNVQNSDTSTFKIVRDTSIQNEKWYFIGRDSTARELLTNRSDGLWYMRLTSSGTVAQSVVLFAKHPANVNDTWLGPDSTTAKLLAKNVSVTVPQGTYSCFQYTYANKNTQDLQQTKYFPVGVGFVRDEFYSKTSSGQSYVAGRRELIGLSLNKLSPEGTTANTSLSIADSFWGQ
jgi:hypothetical protein